MSTPTTGINGSATLSTSGTTLSPPTTPGASTNSLGQNDFLTLMMDQLKSQDPLNPSDPTQFLSELAQFTSLEQQNNIATNTASAATQQSSASALALLGHTVSYTDSSGVTQSGTVSKVDFSSTGGPTLTIGAAGGISLTSVTEAS
ncbi:MAG TPA: flagellar hook capping FlgD N-terminal domain-containing protein [Solirubrobacteraceae bacterium]|jgi:flagellar basal-body rod modification protein FlgD|nr:flagellar hook capping FlgD N-terminal domain-containing protein [Solirubrobacteraceae bacterium]